MNKGIEISLISKPINLHPSKKLGSLTINLNLALLDARYVKYEIKNPSTTVIDLNGKWVENAPGVIQRISGVYSVGKLELSVSHNRVTESYATATNANFSTNGNSGNIPGYQVWDASINWQFTKSFYISGSVNNFTNTRYFTRRSTGYPGPGLLPADGRTAIITIGFKI
jgi:Fe(3+) dicitrate transport protein